MVVVVRFHKFKLVTSDWKSYPINLSLGLHHYRVVLEKSFDHIKLTLNKSGFRLDEGWLNFIVTTLTKGSSSSWHFGRGLSNFCLIRSATVSFDTRSISSIFLIIGDIHHSCTYTNLCFYHHQELKNYCWWSYLSSVVIWISLTRQATTIALVVRPRPI